MNRLKIDKDNPLYDLIDVVIEPGFYRDQSNYKEDKTISIKELVETYHAYMSLDILKHNLLYLGQLIKEKLKDE